MPAAERAIENNNLIRGSKGRFFLATYYSAKRFSLRLYFPAC